jgi:hypothetical protein
MRAASDGSATRRNGRWWIRLALPGLVSFLCGCATERVTHSGFLSDYSQLAPAHGNARDMVRLPPPGLDLSRYAGVVIDPPKILAPGLTDAQRRRLSFDLTDSLSVEFAAHLPVTTAHGPGILRVRTAITDVHQANVKQNVATLLFIPPLSNGGAAAEAEISDGGTQQVIAQIAFADVRGASSPSGFFSKTGHAKKVLQEFAVKTVALVYPESSND